MKASAYPLYKTSGEAWLGDVPSHWELQRIKHSLSEKKSRKGGSLPCGAISFGNVVTKDSESIPIETRQTYQEVLAGEYLINPINLNYDLKSLRTAHSSINVCVSPAYIVVNPNEAKILPKYGEYLLYLFDIAHMKTLGAGVRQTITFKDIGNCIWCLPPLVEQKQIAEFLNKEATRIDSLIEKKTRFIELLKEKRYAFITNATSGGLNKNCELKNSGSVWLGSLPMHWKVVPLKAIADVQLSNIDKKTIDGEPEVFLCNYVDVYKNEKITTAMKFMRATASLQQLQRLKLQSGDVLLTKDSESPDDIGIPSLVAEEVDAVCGYHLAMARPRKNLLVGGYLAWFLRSHHAKVYFENEAKGMTRYGIDKSSLKDTPIGLPPLSEQVAIADQIDRETARIDGILLKTKITIDLLKERRAALITAAVTGKIDVRNSK